MADSSAASDRRQYVRIGMMLEVLFRFTEATSRAAYRAVTRDISESGMCLLVDEHKDEVVEWFRPCSGKVMVLGCGDALLAFRILESDICKDVCGVESDVSAIKAAQSWLGSLIPIYSIPMLTSNVNFPIHYYDWILVERMPDMEEPLKDFLERLSDMCRVGLYIISKENKVLSKILSKHFQQVGEVPVGGMVHYRCMEKNAADPAKKIAKEKVHEI